jgi:hypothetical protein
MLLARRAMGGKHGCLVNSAHPCPPAVGAAAGQAHRITGALARSLKPAHRGRLAARPNNVTGRTTYYRLRRLRDLAVGWSTSLGQWSEDAVGSDPAGRNIQLFLIALISFAFSLVPTVALTLFRKPLGILNGLYATKHGSGLPACGPVSLPPDSAVQERAQPNR